MLISAAKQIAAVRLVAVSLVFARNHDYGNLPLLGVPFNVGVPAPYRIIVSETVQQVQHREWRFMLMGRSCAAQSH